MDALFTTPLSELSTEPYLPEWLHFACDYIIANGLCSEGIFRLSVAGQKLSEYKESVMKGCFEPPDHDPLVVANLLKVFFRHQKEPLLLTENFEVLIQLMGRYDEDKESVLSDLKSLITQLPKANQMVLHYLLHTLNIIASNNYINMMTPHNLGVVWGPNLVWRSWLEASEVDTVAIMSIATLSTEINKIVSVMISEYDVLYPEPFIDVYPTKQILSIQKKVQAFGESPFSGLCLAKQDIYEGSRVISEHYVVGADHNGVIYIFDQVTGKNVKEITTNLDIFSIISVDKTILLATATGLYQYTFEGEQKNKIDGFYVQVCYDNEDTVLVVSDNEISVIDMDEFTIDSSIKVPLGNPKEIVTCVHFCGNTVFCGTNYSEIFAFSLRTMQLTSQPIVAFNERGKICGITDAENNSCGLCVCIAHECGKVIFMQPETFSILGNMSVNFNDSTSTINTMYCMKDVALLASRYGKIGIYSLKTTRKIGEIEKGNKDGVLCILSKNETEYSPYIWTAAFDGSISQWYYDESLVN
ncbi:hypothetical protein EIN_175790 [Entamoeba invadens IP1]|uniref:hypothetical protein n=1 Tax=Entamoeba invadens IP1 TaxID=370355 RepID=UPI0002C3DDD3|nr:hypothetical protein EIN_175790 [Entamoeba invadens IP1]ELP93792.1 hypothetical protein EIN_175790 [Entamoeba invadens IP1]|eukprot:XP_004260563.1 hypothetical protein EIN_175790 [Entamoeba invadens IP1]